MISAARSTHVEMRDTATRTLGKMCESIHPALVAENQKKNILAILLKNLDDEKSSIRAKSVRSLGKLSKYEYLNDKDKAKLKETFKKLLGENAAFNWDHAYIVRTQAVEALRYL